ncbi:hypothetical protein EWM64_g1816 [Hericium alpestre]|uniref:C2H2-type domain-containing protein n=1 Tax=Hericium alpestre TaxID=135208 RepID=A0A4Z0A5A9_9AGAM|nr:hypothetical protein EWM64_g1816 [Hericium alpestre]
MSSQPIALPNGSNSVPTSSAAFNPASYTRAFFGSPISWRAGSFGSRFYPGTSPGQLLAPLELVHPSSPHPSCLMRSSASELRTKLSSSIDSDPGSLLNALNALEREDELVRATTSSPQATLTSPQCRNYTCCGMHLTDLHALVEHFEECHVVVLDPNAPPPSHNPAPSYPTPPPSTPAYAQHNPPSYYPPPPHAPPQSTDDMELDMELDLDSSPASSSASSPPQTPLASFPLPLNTPYPHNSHFAPPYPGHAATAPSSPISAFDTTAVLPAQQYPHQAFNAYAGYADFSRGMPGTDSSVGVPPALLFGSHHPAPAPALSNAPARPPQTPASTPSSSRVSSPLPASTPRASTTLSRPASSLLLSKPFRCPKPNCSKSYKQANGLKYHMTHGSCNFAPPSMVSAKPARNVGVVRSARRVASPFQRSLATNLDSVCCGKHWASAAASSDARTMPPVPWIARDASRYKSTATYAGSESGKPHVTLSGAGFTSPCVLGLFMLSGRCVRRRCSCQENGGLAGDKQDLEQ